MIVRKSWRNDITLTQGFSGPFNMLALEVPFSEWMYVTQDEIHVSESGFMKQEYKLRKCHVILFCKGKVK